MKAILPEAIIREEINVYNGMLKQLSGRSSKTATQRSVYV